MTEQNKLAENYYFGLQKQQLEIIDSQKQNLKLLIEENQKIDEEIQQNRILLEESIKVGKFSLFSLIT